MPANDRSVRVSDAYRQRLLQLQQRASVLGRWTVTVDDIDGTGNAWLERMLVQLMVIQRIGVTLTAGYVAAFIASELDRRPEPVTVDQAGVGLAQDGRSLDVALAAALITVKTALKDKRAPETALRLGEQRATRIASEAARSAPRVALHAAIEADKRISGWRRVTQGASSCGACLASADGRVRTPSERLHIHPFCDCTAEPVIGAVRETVLRPTGREIFDGMPFEAQAALLGEEKAGLIRSGTVSFERLIQSQPMAVAPDGITERPLAAL